MMPASKKKEAAKATRAFSSSWPTKYRAALCKVALGIKKKEEQNCPSFFEPH